MDDTERRDKAIGMIYLRVSIFIDIMMPYVLRDWQTPVTIDVLMITSRLSLMAWDIVPPSPRHLSQTGVSLLR